MANPGDLSSKKVKNTYKRIVNTMEQHLKCMMVLDQCNSIDVTRITASNASLQIYEIYNTYSFKSTIDTHLISIRINFFR